MADIKVGQAVSVRAPAYADKEFAGTVTSIAPLVEPSLSVTLGIITRRAHYMTPAASGMPRAL